MNCTISLSTREDRDLLRMTTSRMIEDMATNDSNTWMIPWNILQLQNMMQKVMSNVREACRKQLTGSLMEAMITDDMILEAMNNSKTPAEWSRLKHNFFYPDVIAGKSSQRIELASKNYAENYLEAIVSLLRRGTPVYLSGSKGNKTLLTYFCLRLPRNHLVFLAYDCVPTNAAGLIPLTFMHFCTGNLSFIPMHWSGPPLVSERYPSYYFATVMTIASSPFYQDYAWNVTYFLKRLFPDIILKEVCKYMGKSNFFGGNVYRWKEMTRSHEFDCNKNWFRQKYVFPEVDFRAEDQYPVDHRVLNKMNHDEVTVNINQLNMEPIHFLEFHEKGFPLWASVSSEQLANVMISSDTNHWPDIDSTWFVPDAFIHQQESPNVPLSNKRRRKTLVGPESWVIDKNNNNEHDTSSEDEDEDDRTASCPEMSPPDEPNSENSLLTLDVDAEIVEAAQRNGLERVQMPDIDVGQFDAEGEEYPCNAIGNNDETEEVVLGRLHQQLADVAAEQTEAMRHYCPTDETDEEIYARHHSSHLYQHMNGIPAEHAEDAEDALGIVNAARWDANVRCLWPDSATKDEANDALTAVQQYMNSERSLK